MPKARFPPPEWPDPLIPNLGVSPIKSEYLFFFASAIRNWYRSESGLYGRERAEIKPPFGWKPRPLGPGVNRRSHLFFQRFSAGVMAVAFQTAQRFWPSRSWRAFSRRWLALVALAAKYWLNAAGSLSAWRKRWGTPGRPSSHFLATFSHFTGLIYQ